MPNTTKARSSGVALYYPYLHIRDIDWLKWALLYWERVRRIVPERAEDDLNDPLEIKVATGAGLLVNTSPRPYVEGAEKRFEAKIVPLLERDPKNEITDWERIGLALKQESAEVGGIHLDKMTTHLACSLGGKRLAKEFGQWLRIQNGGGGLYMVCLGAEMSEAMGTALATDTPAFSPGGEYLLYGEPPAPSNSPVSSSLLFRLGIEFPSPKALTNLSMKRLVKFHSKRADERRRFRAAVDSLAAAAADLADENALADFLSSNKAELQQALSDHKKSLEELAVTALVSSIDIKVPALLTGGIAMAPFDQLVSLILAGTGITCGLIQWWAQLRSDRRKLVQSCAWHYCLSAKGI